jgi:hypothetical protein
LADYLPGNKRSLAFWRPAFDRDVDPAEAGFILEKDLDGPVVASPET